jgi:hypothetical protein
MRPASAAEIHDPTRTLNMPRATLALSDCGEVMMPSVSMGFIYLQSRYMYTPLAAFKTLCHEKVQTGDKKKKGPVLVSERGEERYRVR